MNISPGRDHGEGAFQTSQGQRLSEGMSKYAQVNVMCNGEHLGGPELQGVCGEGTNTERDF